MLTECKSPLHTSGTAPFSNDMFHPLWYLPPRRPPGGPRMKLLGLHQVIHGRITSTGSVVEVYDLSAFNDKQTPQTQIGVLRTKQRVESSPTPVPPRGWLPR